MIRATRPVRAHYYSKKEITNTRARNLSYGTTKFFFATHPSSADRVNHSAGAHAFYKKPLFHGPPNGHARSAGQVTRGGLATLRTRVVTKYPRLQGFQHVHTRRSRRMRGVPTVYMCVCVCVYPSSRRGAHNLSLLFSASD